MIKNKKYKYFICLTLTISILLFLLVFSFVAITEKSMFIFLADNKWTGIEAIVSFIINFLIIFLTIYLHQSEKKERIAEFKEQQKQIDEQRREADFDRKALMLQNRINLFAEREVEDPPFQDYEEEDFIYDLIVEAIFFNPKSAQVIGTKSGFYANSDKCYKEIYVRNPWFPNSKYFQRRSDECDILLSFFNDFHKYCLESNRDDLYWYLKLNSKFSNYLSRVFLFNGSLTYKTGDYWFTYAVLEFYRNNLKTKNDFMNDPEIMKNHEFALENSTEYLIDSDEKDTLYLKPSDALDSHKCLYEYVIYKSEIYKRFGTWMDYDSCRNKMLEVMRIYSEATEVKQS